MHKENKGIRGKQCAPAVAIHRKRAGNQKQAAHNGKSMRRNLTAPNTHNSSEGKIYLQCKPANHHIYPSTGYNEKTHNNIQNSVIDKISGYDLLKLLKEEMQTMYNGRIIRPLLVLGSSPHGGPQFLAWPRCPMLLPWASRSQQ